MAHLRIEPRADGSLLLTDTRGGARWAVGAAWSGAGGLLLAAVAVGDVSPLGGAVVVPLGLIALLAGIAAVRHRDWIVFDRRGRQIAFRRGLGSIFRPVRALPFDGVEAIVVSEAELSGSFEVELRRAGDVPWHVDTSADPAYVSRLVTSLHEVGGWPVVRDGIPQRPPYRVGAAGSPS